MKKLCMILPLTLILYFMVGCQDKEAKAELEKYRVQAEVEEQNKAVIMQQGELLNKRDFDALKELLAPEYLCYIPSRSTKSLSRDEYVEIIKTFRNAFPDINWKILELIPVGDRVIMRYIGRGTHKGEYRGIPATGNHIEYGGTALFRIENGKVVEEMADNDTLGIMLQLGMEFSPRKEK